MAGCVAAVSCVDSARRSRYRVSIERASCARASYVRNVRQSCCSNYGVRAGACDSADVLSVLRRHVMEAELLEEHQTEMTFILPVNRGQRSYFAGMFEDLESRKNELCIASYGVSDTTLEEVSA